MNQKQYSLEVIVISRKISFEDKIVRVAGIDSQSMPFFPSKFRKSLRYR